MRLLGCLRLGLGLGDTSWRGRVNKLIRTAAEETRTAARGSAKDEGIGVGSRRRMSRTICKAAEETRAAALERGQCSSLARLQTLYPLPFSLPLPSPPSYS
jgi:hypothetical protein